MRVAVSLLISFALAACGKRSEVHVLQGVTYYFPAPQISGIVKPEDSGAGQYFVRLTPPGDYYMLIHDPRTQNRANKQGPGVPTIFHINDTSTAVTSTHKYDEVELVRNGAGLVICKKNPVNDHAAAMREIFSCGFRVDDKGVAWDVIIPGDLVASAPALKRRALITLADYRRMGAYAASKR